MDVTKEVQRPVDRTTGHAALKPSAYLRRATKLEDRLIFALLAAFGLAVNLHFSRLGFMPGDQSIVFDGGWRIAIAVLVNLWCSGCRT